MSCIILSVILQPKTSSDRLEITGLINTAKLPCTVLNQIVGLSSIVLTILTLQGFSTKET